MLPYLLRRLCLAAVTLLLVTLVVYALVRSMPGDPSEVAAGDDPSRRISAADWHALKQAFGLEMPAYQAYFVWLANVLRGDLGESFAQQRPVAEVMGRRLAPTLLLSLSAFCLAYGLAIPLGLWTAARRGRADERLLSTSLALLYSVPIFVAALFLQRFMAVSWQWLPLAGMHSENYDELNWPGRVVDVLRHAALPVLCYTYGTLVYVARFIQANVLEELGKDYIRTARAKGLSPRQVLLRHAFPNTLVPLVTLLGLTMPALLSGSVIIEQIFAWPGLGRLFFDSVRARDYPVIMALVLLYSVLTLAGQLLADLAASWLDPRIRAAAPA